MKTSSRANHAAHSFRSKLAHGLRWLLVAYLLVFFLFLSYVALANSILGLNTRGETQPKAQPAVSQPSTPSPALLRRNRLTSLESRIRAGSGASKTGVGIALVDSSGQKLVSINSNTPFVLASVSKVYLLACYLDDLYQEGKQPDDSDMELLDPMIRYSDNDSADAIWEEIGGIQGLGDFLKSKGMKPLDTADTDEWGRLEASANQVAGLMSRLVSGRLLDPASTHVALDLLSNVDDDQAWGVKSGLPESGTHVYMKDGWYPETDGWRINTAGAIQTPAATYFLAIFAYPAPTMEDGVSLVESIAAQVNRIMMR